MAELRVSELPTAVTLDDSDLLLLSQPDANSDTGYASAKTTNVALATKIAKNTSFGDLVTTSKKLIGAINELKGEVGAQDLADLDDVNVTTPAAGECLQYNGTSQKWENKNILAVNETTLTEPYVYKQVPNGKYTEKLKKLIGASVVWNQLIQNGDFSDGTDKWATSRSAISVSNNIATVTCTDNGASAIRCGNDNTFYDLVNRKILVRFKIKSSLNKKYSVAISTSSININRAESQEVTANTWTDINLVMYPTTENATQVRIGASSVVGDTFDIRNIQIIDLTAEFGSAIADYVYSLETSQAGSGIAWLKSYGFFTEDYYAYSANTIQSVSVSKHITKDSDSQTLTETNLDHTTLRGIFKLDANNNLYADGDIYNADGSEDVKYEERAYASGDESLPDTITDGTTTVTKKATPTTATLTPFNPLSTIEQGGTEEFVDYGVEQGNRDVAIPAGNESVYGDNKLMGEIIKYINN